MDKKTTLCDLTAMYTKDMKRYLKRSLPAEFFTHPAHFRALALGFAYLFLVITQLFTYEKFGDIVSAYRLPGGMAIVFLVAGLVPLLEVAALPFLLSMRISRCARRISRISMLAVPILWLGIALWLVFTSDMTTESGLFGATIPVGSGMWLVAFSVLLGWSAYLVNRELPKRHAK